MNHRHTNTCTSPGLHLSLVSDCSRSEEPGVKGCRKKKKGKQHFWGTCCFPPQAMGASSQTSDGLWGPSWSNKAGYHRLAPKSTEVKGNIYTDFSGSCSLLGWALGSRTEPGRAAWRRVHEGNIGVILWDVWVVAEEFMWKPQMWWLIKDKDSLKEKMRKDVLVGCVKCVSWGDWRSQGPLISTCWCRAMIYWQLCNPHLHSSVGTALAPQSFGGEDQHPELYAGAGRKPVKGKNAPKEGLWCSWSSGRDNTGYTGI